MIEKLITRVECMEDRLCRCQEGKGKGKAVDVLVFSVLGSPLVLDCPLTGSDDSYHTPPVVSSEGSSSSSGPNKENVAVDSQLIEIQDEVMENPLPVPTPELDFQGIARLLAVRGQCAVWSNGPPKSAYHPYARCCAIGDRVSTHQPSSLCLPSLPARRGSSSLRRVGDERHDSPSESSCRVGSDGRWAHGF